MDAAGKIKEKQPGNSKQHSKERLTKKDIEKLMEHSLYRRAPGGSIRQVR